MRERHSLATADSPVNFFDGTKRNVESFLGDKLEHNVSGAEENGKVDSSAQQEQMLITKGLEHGLSCKGQYYTILQEIHGITWHT